MNNKIGYFVAAFLLIFLALVAYSTLHGPRYRVEVCMAFNNHTTCKTVSGKSEEAALRSGITNACADMASGVSETMRCEQSQPASLKWLARPSR